MTETSLENVESAQNQYLFPPGSLSPVHPITDMSVYFSAVGKQFSAVAVSLNGQRLASLRFKLDGHRLQFITDKLTVDALNCYMRYDLRECLLELRQRNVDLRFKFLDSGSLTEFVLKIERWVVSSDFGRFEFIRDLDKGCFGSVKLMRDGLKDGKLVTLKTVAIPGPDDRDALRSLLNEVHILRKVRHRHVVKMYSVLQDSKTVSLITEYIKGGTLEGLLEQRLVDETEAIRVTRALLLAVKEANKHFFVHRDIKPLNIMWKWGKRDGKRIWKLIDFGLSENFTDFSEQSLMRDRTGTVCYMAPEILDTGLTGGVYTELVDVYSIGIVLYEL